MAAGRETNGVRSVATAVHRATETVDQAARAAAGPAGQLWLRRRAAEPQCWLAEGQAAGGLECGLTIFTHVRVVSRQRRGGLRLGVIWLGCPSTGFRQGRRRLSGTVWTPSMGREEGGVCGVWRTQCLAGIRCLVSEAVPAGRWLRVGGGVSAHVSWSPEGADRLTRWVVSAGVLFLRAQAALPEGSGRSPSRGSESCLS